MEKNGENLSYYRGSSKLAEQKLHSLSLNGALFKAKSNTSAFDGLYFPLCDLWRNSVNETVLALHFCKDLCVHYVSYMNSL